MASSSRSAYGERGEGGGREPGRRGLPVPFFRPPPTATATTTATTTTNTAAAPVPSQEPRYVLRPRAGRAPARPPQSATPGPEDGAAAAAAASSSSSFPPDPEPTFENIVPEAVGPQDFMHVNPNTLKLERVAHYGAILPQDVLEYHNGSRNVRVRITRIGYRGHLVLHVIDPPSTGQPRLLRTREGRPTFQNPAEVVAALRSEFGGRNPGTHWNALVLWRGTQRVGTLNEVRERLRLLGRRGQGDAGSGAGGEEAAPATAPGPATAPAIASASAPATAPPPPSPTPTPTPSPSPSPSPSPARPTRMMPATEEGEPSTKRAKLSSNHHEETDRQLAMALQASLNEEAQAEAEANAPMEEMDDPSEQWQDEDKEDSSPELKGKGKQRARDDDDWVETEVEENDDEDDDDEDEDE